MHRLTLPQWMLCCSVLFCWCSALGQSGVDVPASSALRYQVQAIAEALSRNIQLKPASRLGVQVSGSGNKEFTENIFCEVLQKKGFTVSLSPENVDAIVDVFVTAITATYDEIEATQWKRTIRVALEARIRFPDSQDVRYLGNHEYSQVDTVSQKEEGWWSSGESTLLPGPSPGMFERIITPFVVIVAAVVVVYLFFTVRN